MNAPHDRKENLKEKVILSGRYSGIVGETGYRCQVPAPLMRNELPSALGGEQFNNCFLRSPVPAVLTKRCRVRIDESNQHLRHDPAANGTQTMTSCTGVCFAENVVPQRSLALPARGGDANLLGGERGDSDV